MSERGPDDPGAERGQEAGPAGEAGQGHEPQPAPAEEAGVPESYEAAVARLDQIIARLDSGKAELRETLGLVREGKALVEYCKGELDAVSGELEKLDLDTLVAQLESAEGE